MWKYPPADAGLLQQIRERIAQAGVSHLITRGSEGYPRARAMGDQLVSADWVFYMFTDKSSRKIAEIRAEPRVALGFYEPASKDYICVFGRADVVLDDAERARFWKDAWLKYWPGGPTDPEYAIVRIAGEAVEYFDMASEKLHKLSLPRA